MARDVPVTVNGVEYESVAAYIRSNAVYVHDPPDPKHPQCPICGKCRKLTRHHIVPKSRGGRSLPWNMLKVCRTCHTEIHSLFDNVTLQRMSKTELLGWLGNLRYTRRQNAESSIDGQRGRDQRVT